MRLKSELYKKEQEEICNKVINILKLDWKNYNTKMQLKKNIKLVSRM